MDVDLNSVGLVFEFTLAFTTYKAFVALCKHYIFWILSFLAVGCNFVGFST